MRTVHGFTLAAGLLALALTFFGCSSGSSDDDGQQLSSFSGGEVGNSSPSGTTGGKTFADSRDGKAYRWVEIGDQIWMAENLNYNADSSFCYGEGGLVLNPNSIYYDVELSAAQIQANCAKYGRLYDWETAKTVCPSGWHLPSKDEWDELLSFIAADNGCANCDALHLKSTNDWSGDGNGEDTYGFAALPGGLRSFEGYFSLAGNIGSCWSDTEYRAESAYCRLMSYLSENGAWSDCNREGFFSVRCLKD